MAAFKGISNSWLKRKWLHVIFEHHSSYTVLTPSFFVLKTVFIISFFYAHFAIHVIVKYVQAFFVKKLHNLLVGPYRP